MSILLFISLLRSPQLGDAIPGALSSPASVRALQEPAAPNPNKVNRVAFTLGLGFQQASGPLIVRGAWTPKDPLHVAVRVLPPSIYVSCTVVWVVEDAPAAAPGSGPPQ
ncbi:MAG: hypothetical protein BGO49_02050 [Planctomycetales bacterium 71-10]|nr:MAG: hypothetical protein BGO49_02050 [Planctomycetales bacterium 71-10]